MSTQEQATLIGQELERKLSIFKTYDVFYDNITDGDDFYVEIQPNDDTCCISSSAMTHVIDCVKQHNLRYLISATNSGNPTISIF